MPDEPTVIVSTRLYREEIAQIDAIARRETRNRAQQIAHLVRLGLRKRSAFLARLRDDVREEDP